MEDLQGFFISGQFSVTYFFKVYIAFGISVYHNYNNYRQIIIYNEVRC